MAILDTHDFAYINSSDKNTKIVSKDNYVKINSSGDYAKIALIKTRYGGFSDGNDNDTKNTGSSCRTSIG